MKSFGQSKEKMFPGSQPPKANYLEVILWLFGFRKRYTISGNSMLPLFKPGDNVLVRKSNNLSVGLFVVAKHPEKDLFIIKTIKQLLPNNKLVLSGINSEESSSFHNLPSDQILGIVSSIL